MKNAGISSFSVAAHLENSDPWGSRRMFISQGGMWKKGKKKKSLTTHFFFSLRVSHHTQVMKEKAKYRADRDNTCLFVFF